MKFTRSLILLVSTTLFISACSQESEQSVAAPVKANSNALLAYAPVDTPYVFAALEPTPTDVLDAYIDRFQPVLDVVSKQIEEFQTAYADGEFEDEDEKFALLASAVLDELGGDVSVESLTRLGFDVQADHVVYGMGIFPVARVGLSDAQALRDAIGRVEAKVGFDIPEKDLNGTAYWVLTDEEMPVAVYIAILDRHLAVSLFPQYAEDKLLASFLGQEMPSNSIASNNTLAILNSEKGYTNYGSGILDFEKLAGEMFGPDSTTISYFGPNTDIEFPEMNDVCLSELNAMIAKAPRITAGTTALTADEISMRYDLEMESSLALSLASLVSSVPTAATGDHLLSASLAIQVGKLRSFVLDQVNAVIASPFQCEEFQDMNEFATQMLAQLNIPMPPMVNNLSGIRLIAEDFDPSADIPTGTGLLAVHIAQPEMLIGMASMMIPGVTELDLANQSEPVQIPAEMLPIQGVDMFALMTDDAIGVSVGKAQAQPVMISFKGDGAFDGHTVFIQIHFNP